MHTEMIEERLEEILFRLPIKSIGRFRIVCKYWNSLLSQPHFIRTHLNRIKQYPIQEQSLILAIQDQTLSSACYRVESLFSVNLKSTHQVFDEMTTPPLLPTKLNFAHDQLLDMLSCCDGLFVVQDMTENLILINPVTREFKELPKSPDDGWNPNDIYGIGIGIGFDSSTDDYKVVTISSYVGCSDDNDYEDFEVRVKVYSVKNGTWKTLSSFEFDYEDGFQAGGVYLNGHIHWIAKNLRKKTTVIAAFDLKEEKFWELPAPSSFDSLAESESEFKRESESAQFVIIGGCLCLSWLWCIKQYQYESYCFVMEEYNVKDSWTEIPIVHGNKLAVRPVCLLGEEQMVFLIYEEGPNEELVMFNWNEGTYKEVEIQGFADELAIKGTFVTSLLSPHYVYKDEASKEE